MSALSRCPTTHYVGLVSLGHLGDLGLALKALADSEPWGEVVHVDFPSQDNFVQMILSTGGADLYSNGKRFREEAARPSLTPWRPKGHAVSLAPEPQDDTNETLFVEMRGGWPQVASQLTQLITGIYGTGDDEQVEVKILE